ncbi:MAG TPA: cell division protein ZipA [Rhodanobacteraceae bacterium]|nr:cell division protein ZipA [Rhodanobacteraceae bacterium]
METQTLSPTEMRIIIALVGVVVLALIYWFGRPRKPEQGRRGPQRGRRVEPTLDGSHAEGDAANPTEHDEAAADAAGMPRQGLLDVGLPDDVAGGATAVATPAASVRRASTVGKRPVNQPMERIVNLFVVARLSGAQFRGSDLVVAAEKAGLEFGDMGIFHRMIDGKPELGPVFSVANMLKPGAFDMSAIDTLQTPGLSVFMTLPGPLPALDAWDAMLPTAQRLAELLDGQVVDEQRNALGRQRIAYIRDDMRAWDRGSRDS